MLTEFLNNFLSKRNLTSPDGRMLYAYQTNKSEYFELRDKLKQTCQNEELIYLLKHNKTFSKCFVLYASEWWKREYSGGPWEWSPIFQTISNNVINNNEVGIRSNAIKEALKYWEYYDLLETGKKFIGAIITNGGLPLKFIECDNQRLTSIAGVLHKILKFANEHNIVNDEELFIRIKETSQKLPEAIKKDEIYNLMTKLISTIIKLKIQYKLDKVTNPKQVLDEQCPSWREQLPLSMEDVSIEKMLIGFVEEVSKFKINNKIKFPYVDRIFDFSESDQLKFSFSFPECEVPAEYFSKFFEISNDDEQIYNKLPQKFFINNLEQNNTPIAIVKMTLGSKNRYKIRKASNNDLNGILNSVTIYLSSADNKIYSKLITISENLNIEKPFVFVKNEDDILILKSNENVYLKENECYVAYEPNIFDFSNFGTFERIVNIDNNELYLIKCTSNIETEEFFVKLNSNPSNNKYCLDGDIISYKTYPYVAYKGIPKIVCYDYDNNRIAINSNNISYSYKDKDTSLIIDNNQKFSGILDIHCKHNDINKVYKAIVFPDNFQITFNVNNGETIKFNNIDCKKIEPLSVDFSEISKNEFKFNLDKKPDNICFKITWHNDETSLIYIPYPCKDVSFFDENGNCINSHKISMHRLMGKKIKIYNNLIKGEKYKLFFKLEKYNKEKVETSFSIFTHDSLTEIRLIDYEDDIKKLLNYSNNEDDLLEISVHLDNKQKCFIEISHYDTDFIVENDIIRINKQLNIYSDEMLENTNIIAINLFDPQLSETEASVIQLTKNINNKFTGCWNIKNLDCSTNVYMIMTDEKSDISIKPYILYSNSTFEKLSDFRKKIITLDFDKIEDLLKSYKSDSWKDIANLLQIFISVNIPLTSFKLWQALCSNESLLAKFLLFFSSNLSIIKKIKEELICIPAIISFEIWKIAINKYLQYIQEEIRNNVYNKTSENTDIELISKKIKEIVLTQFGNLTNLFPEIEVTIFYLLNKLYDNFEDIIEIEDIIPYFKILNQYSTEELYKEIFIEKKRGTDNSGENPNWSCLQRLQHQNSLIEKNWISIPFEKIKSNIERSHSEKLKNLSPYLFKFTFHSDFIKNVVNFPQICAFYCFYNAKMKNEFHNLMKFSIRDFMNFNQNYFIDVYKRSIFIMIKFNNVM